MNPPTLYLHVDYADQLMDCDQLYDEEKIANLMATAKSYGIDGINWRVDGIGGAFYPSNIAITADHFDEQAALNPPEHWVYPPNFSIDSHKKLAKRTKQALDTFDPVKSAGKYARENDLKFNIYFCPLDQYWPGRTGKVLKDYPYACWQSKDGKMKLPLVSLAYPEVREYFHKQCKELMAYDFDSLYVYIGCHGWYGFPLGPEDDFFGYEEPVVEDFKQRYGIDIRTSKSFDKTAWHKLKGEYYTSMLKDLHSQLTAKSRKLIAGVMLGDYNIYSRWAQPRQFSARYYVDWKKWTGWKNVDLSVGDQSDIWTYSLWQSHPDMLGQPDKMPYEFIDQYYGGAEERNFKIFVFRALHNAKAKEEIETVCKAWPKFTADGIVIREAAVLEFHQGWQIISDLKSKLIKSTEV